MLDLVLWLKDWKIDSYLVGYRLLIFFLGEVSRRVKEISILFVIR